jgi:hypothetical protein
MTSYNKISSLTKSVKFFGICILLALVVGKTFAQYPVGDNEPARNSATSSRSLQQSGEMPMQSTGPQADRSDSKRMSAGSEASATNKMAYRTSSRSMDGQSSLPNDAGQVWREYDISPYTARVTNTKKPEQAIIDWILRDTGYEAWHSDPLAVLSANNRTLRVYHTPEMQNIVTDLVDRFISSDAASQTFGMRVITLDSPSWRTKSQPLLKPVAVQTPGVCAWIMAKEDYSILMADFRRRSDFREHSSPYLMVNNGQSTVVSAMRSRQYARDIYLRSDFPSGGEVQGGQVDEGFTIDFSPLLSTDKKMIDASIKCEIDQVEKMIPIVIDTSSKNPSQQRFKVEEPQMTHYRFHERFRWPVESVLLIGMGMVALPVPVDGRPIVPGIPIMGTTPARADLLVFIECKGSSPNSQNTPYTATKNAKNYRGRY